MLGFEGQRGSDADPYLASRPCEINAVMLGDGSYADLQCWRLEGGDLDFALETRCGMPEQCSSGENAEDVRSQAGESMSGTIGAAWQQK